MQRRLQQAKRRWAPRNNPYKGMVLDIYIYTYTNERIALSCGALFSFAGRAKLSWGVYAVQSIASNVEKGGGALGTAKRGNKYF